MSRRFDTCIFYHVWFFYQHCVTTNRCLPTVNFYHVNPAILCPSITSQCSIKMTLNYLGIPVGSCGVGFSLAEFRFFSLIQSSKRKRKERPPLFMVRAKLRCTGGVWRSHQSPYSTAKHRVPELIPILGSRPAGDVSHKPGNKLPLHSIRPTVTLATLKSAATSFAAWCLFA